MKYEILHSVMSSSVYDSKALQAFPKNCIEYGLYVPVINKKNVDENFNLKFYGSVNDTKGNLVWAFEISVFFKVDLPDRFLTENEEQLAIDEFMKKAHEKVALTFDGFVAGKDEIQAYVLCPPEIIGLDRKFFI